jgi:diguanylate cyclase (GGDEF)-like protein
MEHRFRSRYGRAAVVRAALLVFLFSGALIAAVVFTLDRNARQSNNQQAGTELESVARVAASKFSIIRANLRTRAGELATSPQLQSALLGNRTRRLEAIAQKDGARIVTRHHALGALASGPRITAKARIASGGRVIAELTVAVPLDGTLLNVLETTTPMPSHANLLFLRNGRLLGRTAIASMARIGHDSVRIESMTFAAREVDLGVDGASLVALEPASAIAARVAPFRRRLFLAAALTLALAAGLAARLGRPAARVLADLARLSRQAQTDGLTGLANRGALDQRLDDEVDHARRLGTSVSFVIADIDNFKSINDHYGHQTGDDVLRAVSTAFAQAVRELDLVGRYGGEELAGVLPGTSLAGGRRLAERVRTALAELQLTGPSGERIEVTASFGVACFPTYGSVETLVAAADSSLYEAKRSGKNAVVTATVKKKARGVAERGAIASG